ncbi:MAG: histidine--tRNA ligase [Halobacteriaceae archaeon]
MYDRLKGFRDRYPREMEAHRRVIDVVEDVARRYGFREIGTPAMERTALYVEKSGEEVVEDLYAFTDQGGREVALAPELTPTVARMVAERGQELAKPIKWYSTRPFWRYEDTQQGRSREFYQTNVDVLGSDDPAADAEIMAVAAESLLDLGLDPGDFEFRVSHRDILSELLETVEPSVDTRAAIRAVDKRAKIDEAEYVSLLTEAGLTASQAQEFDDLIATDDLDAVAGFGGPELADAVENLRAVLSAAADFGVREHCTVSLRTARGLDYYTGVVFECFDAEGEIGRAVFGGGRYDDLVEGLGGPPTPAVGFAPGVMNSTLPLLLQRAGAWPAESLHTDYYVLQVGDTRETAARIAADLRDRGHVVETDVAGRSFGAQLEYADSVGAETTVIVGEQDLADGMVTVKDMDSGDQTRVAVESFPGDRERPTYADLA